MRDTRDKIEIAVRTRATDFRRNAVVVMGIAASRACSPESGLNSPVLPYRDSRC